MPHVLDTHSPSQIGDVGSSQGPARHPHGSAHGATPHQPAADPATSGGHRLPKGLHDRWSQSSHPASGSTCTLPATRSRIRQRHPGWPMRC